MKGKRIKIQLQDGRTIAAKVEYHSGDNMTVQGADGFIYEVDRNVREDNGAYVVMG